jgi:organic radical activating enzyme
MVKQIIKANPDFKKPIPLEENFLNISEFFYDTIQGEGINIGMPAAFLRVQGCTQSCIWCDTKEVWRFGNPYTFNELFELIDESDLVDKLNGGQHLVLTGGSPLLQERQLTRFIQLFIDQYGFKPYIEIENECTIMPGSIFPYINCWNNSPKLNNSGNPYNLRYQPDIIKTLSLFPNSYFKFVVTNMEDWKEIFEYFLQNSLIKKSQIILMPQGATREELEKNREFVINLAIKNNVRYCTREHIVVWDKKTGV